MKRSGEQVTLTDEDGEAVAFGEGFDIGAGVGDAGGADEDHLERTAFELGWRGENGGVDLATVGVALDGDVEDGERFLRGIFYLLCQQDGSGAGAEGWGGFDEGLQDVEEAVALKKFEESGGLAAGDDEAVEVFELCRVADELCGDAERFEGFGVGFKCALQGEDADGERFGHNWFNGIRD